MEWKYYEYLKTLDFKYGEDIIKKSILQIVDDNNQKLINRSFKWSNQTKLKHDDYWILNQVIKNEKYNVKEVLDTYQRIIKNKVKRLKKMNNKVD
ncbi:hypothetical protein EELLY_v1c03610 [Entomoplasma ellychniae]|uniref:Uncharacterized protein n=1 Tax=Entomoplasma ellychniae TaxID=2114 RepID=A0A8E2QXW5_9MOLU|nr:hypothetical protein [Entomoplasma ellychniae]PPE04358.1 hypothetical protein EELLY_v1c00320 [Entomoplasma ellychniae]PPE04610.1 hypothetical protein EELLY_v1c02900 [Entomoplasma ellychniae]PPE04681.1 hypothetical protein EELLY_v1c03610 [Entomoplasma ellychniae]